MVAVGGHADGGLLRNTFELCESGGDGVEFVVGVGCQRGRRSLPGRIGRGDIEDVVPDIELEIGTWVHWFWACSKVARLDAGARGSGVVAYGVASGGRAPCVAGRRTRSFTPFLLMFTLAAEGAVAEEAASALLKLLGRTRRWDSRTWKLLCGRHLST